MNRIQLQQIFTLYFLQMDLCYINGAMEWWQATKILESNHGFD
jgi:hypothetical protein